MAAYRLIMNSGPSIGKVFMLDKPEMFIGRDLNNDIVINDPEISRRHARLVLQQNGYILEDLGSTNGTFFQGQRLTAPLSLQPAQVITFGERITVAYEVSPDAAGDTLLFPSEPPAEAEARPATARPAPPAAVFQSPPPPQAPAPAPVAQPVYQQNVFADPQEEQPEPRGNKGVMALLLIETILVILMCLFIVVTIYLIDSNSAWCIYPIWPASACP